MQLQLVSPRGYPIYDVPSQLLVQHGSRLFRDIVDLIRLETQQGWFHFDPHGSGKQLGFYVGEATISERQFHFVNGRHRSATLTKVLPVVPIGILGPTMPWQFRPSATSIDFPSLANA